MVGIIINSDFLSLYQNLVSLSLSSNKKKIKKLEKIKFSTKIKFMIIQDIDYLITKNIGIKINFLNKNQSYHLFFSF
jgi:hypothetical protein